LSTAGQVDKKKPNALLLLLLSLSATNDFVSLAG
jgi:hypothetical protein